MTLLDTITDQLNLRWAWEKVRSASKPGDIWIDEVDLAQFEINLESNLSCIADEIRGGDYQVQPLRPMAFPKNPNKDGEQQLRQYFHFTTKDQVAWAAVVNVVGPHVDPLMPTWSYGYRLFRSIWVEKDDDGIHRRKIGHYRHSSGQIYLPFNQGWPVFRRHVFLTTGAMAAETTEELDNKLSEQDAEELELQKRLAEDYRCPFVVDQYWNGRRPSSSDSSLYWCSLDLQKFYPSLRLKVIRQNIVDCLPQGYRQEAETILNSMMRFRLNTSAWSSESLHAIGLKHGQKEFEHLPTGLFVAGFLANAGMLKIDQEVSRRLPHRNLAHFRYVDDHIILAYDFKSLLDWLTEYGDILATSATGATFNPEKIEPSELAAVFTSKKQNEPAILRLRSSAMRACKLNPQFPAPLMTKTLALVSAIAQTDFNLLDESEQVSLTDQLEQMLLVDLPETEIPEKTRLSFAATRLIKLAESRLGYDPELTQLACQSEAAVLAIESKSLKPEEKGKAESKHRSLLKELQRRRATLDRELLRAFGLLRKVLQEKPDRVRLWTRAIHMCRRTGVKGVENIFVDINRFRSEHHNTLASDYLLANTFVVLGTEVKVAAQIMCDPEIASWRKDAAFSFLTQVCGLQVTEPAEHAQSWFLKASWQQFCFGVFCAKLVLESHERRDERVVHFPKELLKVGASCLQKGKNSRVLGWVWWAARSSLRDLSPRCHPWAMKLAAYLHTKEQAFAFWQFFPLDVPDDALRSFSSNNELTGSAKLEGWWYDALEGRDIQSIAWTKRSRNRSVARAMRNHNSSRARKFITLREWGRHIEKISLLDPSDPRVGEWTALEIVRQIAILLEKRPGFDFNYLAQSNSKDVRTVHPANFRVPKLWIESWSTRDAPTWSDWRNAVREPKLGLAVSAMSAGEALSDSRYTPVTDGRSTLFDSVNPVRGLGLILYGLLRRSFELPAVWNGPGHSDLLSLLPKLLLKDMSFSSWTLGLLQGCLQRRAVENLFLRRFPIQAFKLHDDTIHDPIPLISAKQVANSIQVCLGVLERNQMSTYNHKARQLTPISVKQLSEPLWSHDFDNSSASESNEH